MKYLVFLLVIGLTSCNHTHVVHIYNAKVLYTNAQTELKTYEVVSRRGEEVYTFLDNTTRYLGRNIKAVMTNQKNGETNSLVVILDSNVVRYDIQSTQTKYLDFDNHIYWERSTINKHSTR